MKAPNSEKIFAEQVALIYKLMPVGLIATVINGSVITALLFGHVPTLILLTWAVLLFIVTAARAVEYGIAVKDISQKKRLSLWANLFIAGVFGLGIIWGGAAFFSFYHTSDAHRILVAFVLGGMAAGASATFNVLKRAYFAFSIPALLPQVVLFMISGNTIFIAMGGMLVVFWILITVSAMTNHEATLTSLRLRFERDDLIASLESAQDQTERKNDALQKEIAQREKAESELREAHALLEKKVALRTGELKSANTRLEELNHELSDFTHSVSHDLRTPLTSIEGFTDILEEESGTTLNEPAREALYYIRKSIGRMKDLIQDLLVLARASQMELVMESVDLSSMALEIAGNLRTQQPQRKVEFVIQPGILAVGDARLIRIVLENLIGNAWKYTGKTEQPHIEFSLVKKDQEVIYCLADNGAGFDMKYADKLFAPFQRLHSESAFPGTGIGLATVDKIISRHGGRIWAQSSPGNGARFYFTLGHL